MAYRLRTAETYDYSEYMGWVSFYGGLRLLDKHYKVMNKETGKHRYVVVYKEERR